MKPIVLDTDVVSFLFKADSRAQLYLPHLDNRQWFISFMTAGELEQWALLANWSEERWSLLEETAGVSKPPMLGLRPRRCSMMLRC